MSFTYTGDFDSISTNTCPSIHNDMTDDSSIITNYTYDIRGTGSYSPPCKRKPKLVTTYPGLAPLKGKGYFKPRERQAKTVVGVLIPFYNEGRQELKRTLESLYDQEIECRDLGVEFVYLAIMDGISEADESTIQYVNEIYNDSHWADAMLKSEDRSYVSVLQAAPTDELGDHGLVKIAPGKHMRLTTLVKGINMRKTNSHEWFFVAFCSEYEIDYAFGTDCGTLYAQGCLYYLIDYLNTHPDVSAVTGRQRIMSSSMQSLRTEGLMQMWYRAVQAYDYEASISNFLGAFSLIGMLPVIPGPAGLWRMSVVGGKPMDYYIDYVNSIKPEDGLIMGNLLLAEDRILSYAACLMTGKYTRWVPKAVFYTEAETDSKNFLTQRRRWINGTSASYLYLLFFSPGVIFRGSHSWWFKIVIYSQLLLQTILYAVRTVSPSVFAALIYFAVKSLNIGGDGYNQHVAWGITSCGALLYIVFCLTHFFSKFSRSLYNAVVVWNSFSYMLVVAGLAAAFANADPIAILVLLIAVFMPFFLALLHSLDVFIMMVFSFFQFCAFLPTFIPWFSAYAYCRVWDLSWGNRPSSGSAKGRKSVKTGILHRRIGLVVLLLVMCLNFTVCGLFVRYNSLQGLLVMAIVLVGVALFQQILSFGFYLFYTEHILTAGVRNLTRRSMQILSATLFATTVACVFTGLFTTSWLTNSFPVEQRFNSTVTLNETFVKWEDIFSSDYNETFYTLQDSVVKSSSETLEDVNATDIHSYVLKSSNETIEDANVTDIYNYVRTEVVTVTTLYRLDALRELEGKIFLPNHRINSYYVNNSVVTTITTNYTVNEDGSIGNKLTNVMHDFLSYLNLTYTDDYDRVYGGISTPPDTTYKARYQKKSFLNQTFVQMKADIATLVEGGYVDMYYGLLFVEFDFHTVVPYKSETMLWGSDLMWHFPNQLWAYTLLLIFGCVIFLGLIMLACLYALCTKDRSRVYGVSVLYVWLSICALMAAILLFPMSFFDLKTYRVGWWDVEISASSGYLCGESAHYYNPGDCSLGWSYWLIVVSFFTAVFSYNSAQITLNKPKDKKLHLDLVWKEHTDDDTVYLTDEIEVELDPSRWGRFKAASRRSGRVIASYGVKIGRVVGLVGGSEDDMRQTEVSMLKVRDDMVLSSAPAVETQSVISQWPGLAPVQGGSYFTPRSKQRKLIVGVVVSLAGFTEGNRINTRTQLQRTLESLYDQEQQCHDLDVEFIYMAVMDGMPLADNDITDYISSMYNQQQWADNLRMQHDPRHVTIMQAKVSDAHEHDHGLVEVAPGKRLRMSTIIKGEPAGKVNSHEWFFSAYSSVYEVDYAFTTEIGTTYATSFMFNLINYLESHAHVSAVSGRQRVMSSTMQSLHTEGLTEMFYRAVQSYDQEARITNLQGAQTFVGMLPLISGAAGLWRMSDLEGEPLDYYLDYPKQITLDQGLRVGNLLLAADNVLSYAACLMTGKHTQWVPNAVFYTEAKLESQSFITQRKRWANGTMACYLIMLFNSFGDIFDGPHKLSFKLNVYLHMLLQMVVQAVTGVSPGLMAALAYFSAVEMNFGGDEYKMYVAYGVTAVNCILYVLFCAVHFHKRFSQFTYNIVIAWTIAVTLMVASSVIFMFAASNSTALAIFSVAVLLPSLLALLHSLDVFVIMAVSVFQYVMFLPVFTAWFSAYAYCRVWDVSEYDTLTIKGRAQKGAGLAIMLTVMALNIGVAAALIGLASLDRLMHLFLGVVGLTLIPQFMSLIYFLFYTENCLTGSLRSVSFRWMAVASSVLYALTVVLLCVGCFTTSWLTNSVPVYIHANTTAVLNETRLQYEGPYMLMNETEVFDSIKGDSLASLASHSDLRVGGWDGRVINVNGTILEPEAESKLLGVHSYQTDTIITTSTIWRLDPVKAFETKLNLYHLKFTAYYVNDSTIVTDTANTTLDAHGTVLNTRTHRVAHFQRYLNFSYIDHNGDLQVSIADVSDRNYTNTYQMKTETNETLVLNSLQYTYGRYDGYVDLFYGLFFLELDFHTTTPYKSEVLPWGGDLMSHYPGGSWAFCVLLVCGALVFLGMIAMATLFSFCANDQSRVHGVVIVFMWVIVIALLMCVFLFPASWGGMNTYHIGWWNPDNNNGTYLCGESAGIYNPGDCSVGWSYWMVVLAFVVAMFGYNSARYMLYKPSKQSADHRHLLTTRDVDPE